MNELFVCYASSDLYARETGISLLSLLDLNRDIPISKIFILDYGIMRENKDKIDSIVSMYNRSIEYIPALDILSKLQTEIPIPEFRGSFATYSRAFMDKLMPKYCRHVLYIDSDTVINGSIEELVKFDMGDCCIAGAIGVAFYRKDLKNELDLLTRNRKYYSCGVVMFDLHNWEKHSCFEMIVNTFRKKKSFPFADQSLINNSLPEELIKTLPIKYNYTSHIYNRAWEQKVLSLGSWYSNSELKEAMTFPIVIHYPGSPINRPWYDGCLSQRKDEYLHYRRLSPWSSDAFLSLLDYEKELNGISGHFGYWVHKQEMIQKSYFVIAFIWFIRDSIFICKKLVKTLFKIR